MESLDKSQNATQFNQYGSSRRALLRGLGAIVLAGATDVLGSSLTAATTSDAVEPIAVVVDDQGISFPSGTVPVLRAGTPYQFMVTNSGWMFHRFAVGDVDHKPLGAIPAIAPGATKVLDFTFRAPGRYILVDGVGGDYPLFGTLRVAVPINVIA